MPKYYSADFRLQAVECIERGKSCEEVCDFFGISRATIYRWISEWRKGVLETVNFRKDYAFRKVDKDALKLKIELSPDLTLEELGAEFGCRLQTIDYWCRKLKITRKKNDIIYRKRRKRA
jgi:transposase